MGVASERASLLATEERNEGEGWTTRRLRTVRIIGVSALALGAAAFLGNAAAGGFGGDGGDLLFERVAKGDGRAELSLAMWNRAKYEVTCKQRANWPLVFDHNKTVLTDEERAKLEQPNGQTYISGFWRLPVSHHPPSWYLPNLQATACQLGAFAMNVVFVRDSQQMCDYSMALYKEGSKERGKYQFGGGNAACIVNDGLEIRPTSCSAHSRIWYNKMTIVADVVKRIQNGGISSNLQSKHYFWLDGDIFSGKANRFPRFRTVLSMLDEEDQDKMMLACYLQDMGNYDRKEHRYRSFPQFWDYARTKLGSASQEPRLGLVSSVVPGCTWMRHEVIANIFGGSARVIGEFSEKYKQYIDEHVPTVSNHKRPTSGQKCACPSEEQILTTMANDNTYESLFTKRSCAHRLRTPYNPQRFPWARSTKNRPNNLTSVPEDGAADVANAEDAARFN